MRITVHRRLFTWILVVGLLSSCSTISPFNQVAYEQATSLKVEALALMDKATEPFANHQKDVDALMMKVDKAYEYAKGRPNNSDSTKQWAIIKDPSRNSLGGFLKRWEEKSTLSKTFITEAKGLVSDGFNTVIGLEGGKLKPN